MVVGSRKVFDGKGTEYLILESIFFNHLAYYKKPIFERNWAFCRVIKNFVLLKSNSINAS